MCCARRATGWWARSPSCWGLGEHGPAHGGGGRNPEGPAHGARPGQERAGVHREGGRAHREIESVRAVAGEAPGTMGAVGADRFSAQVRIVDVPPGQPRVRRT